MRYPSETHSESVPSFKNLALNFRSISKVVATTCAVLCCAVPCCLCATVCCMPHHGLHYADFLVSLASFVVIFRFFEMKPSTLMKEEKKTVVKPRANHMQNLKPTECVCVCAKFVAPPGLVLSSPLEACEWFSSVQFSSGAIFIYIQSTVPYAVYPLRTCCSATPHRLFTLCAYGFWASRHTHYR